MICPRCGAPSLEIRLALELPPDARSDEIALQVLGCEACGFEALAMYEESRRGADDVWHHVYYDCTPEEVERVSAAIARCPEPRSPRCGCDAHRELGAHDPGGRWQELRNLGIEPRIGGRISRP